MNMTLGQCEEPTDSAPERRTNRRPDKGNVAIIGGSAAGFFTSTLLAARGVPVRDFERGGTLDRAIRTLIVTQRMRSLLGRAAEGSIVNEIRRFELFTDGRV